MARTSVPGELEHTVLLALAARAKETSGGEVYDRIVKTTGREVALAAVYITLARLEDKGWAEVRTAPPEAGRGGKPRKFFKLSPAGGKILREARAHLEALWESASAHPYVDPPAGNER